MRRFIMLSAGHEEAPMSVLSNGSLPHSMAKSITPKLHTSSGDPASAVPVIRWVVEMGQR